MDYLSRYVDEVQDNLLIDTLRKAFVYSSFVYINFAFSPTFIMPAARRVVLGW